MLTAWVIMAVVGAFFAGGHLVMWETGIRLEEKPQFKLMVDLFFVVAFLILIITKVNS